MLFFTLISSDRTARLIFISEKKTKAIEIVFSSGFKVSKREFVIVSSTNNREVGF